MAIITEAALLLDQLGPFAPATVRKDKWRSTEQLANELHDRGLAIPLDRLDAVLRRYEQRCRERIHRGLHPDALIRRATYPDRTTALPLWGSTKYHGQPWETQPEEHRLDSADDIPTKLRVRPDAPRVFLSHSHQDGDFAGRVAEALAEMGIGSWMFETHVEVRGNIAACVRGALSGSACCAALVTRDSMASLWVLTELHTALTAGRPVVLIVNAADPEVVELLESVRFNHPDQQFDLSVEYSKDILKHLRVDYATRHGPARAERYLAQVHDFLATLPSYLTAGPALAFPVKPKQWSGSIQLEALQLARDMPFLATSA